MTWRDWLREGRVEAHKPTPAEIDAQCRAARRSLGDAGLPGLSPEGRFQLAYAAALDLATATVLASGHRIKARIGHHQLTFEAAGVALGKAAADIIDYLDICRRRRNVVSYAGDEVGEDFANELLKETSRFAELVDEWLEQNHPELL
jgi:hypothetical protein